MAGEAIFIGYRRDDTADVAGRIYDAMAQRFGKARVFKDVDNIGPGVDFGDYIKSVLPKCRVALVLIGPHWLDSKSEDGRRRIDSDQDWVRIEVETALTTPGLLTVPVLINGAVMPRAADIPPSLAPLLRRNAAIVRRDPDFHDDVERLATAIRASVNTGVIDLSRIGGAPAAEPARGGGRSTLLIGGAVAAAALAAVAFGALRSPSAPRAPADDATPVSQSTSAVAGRWVGWASAGNVRFNYRWLIEQRDHDVSGTITLKRGDTDVGAYEFVGKFDGEELVFAGTRFVVPDASFCMAAGSLTLSALGVLEGSWGPNASVPGGCPEGSRGSVHLERQ